jgi:hypothetical protein
MTDPAQLLRRAAELTAQAEHLEDVEARERLLRMAGYYASIAEHEQWLAASSDIATMFSVSASKRAG